MTVLLVLVVVLAAALAAVTVLHLRARAHRPQAFARSRSRILFPFTARALSPRALDAALRLADAEHATLAPVFLASVPLHLPLDTPLPRQCSMAVPLLEAIEQRAARSGVPVDARIERGRDRRHALREAIEHEHYDRIVIAASGDDTDGFHADDVAWLLDHAPGEVIVLRPDGDETIRVREAPLASQHGRGTQVPARAGAGAGAG
jgi:nucleotide-binding universal stress UspA family protein